ncbi:hypothetical protein K438DRAFT_1779621 [Mycena galopus ATCC 62051]|nr:hypothetical protein K438DRAFT_1779621 [Mycena galopus ATCC 62051]
MDAEGRFLPFFCPYRRFLVRLLPGKIKRDCGGSTAAAPFEVNNAENSDTSGFGVVRLGSTICHGVTPLRLPPSSAARDADTALQAARPPLSLRKHEMPKTEGNLPGCETVGISTFPAALGGPEEMLCPSVQLPCASQQEPLLRLIPPHPDIQQRSKASGRIWRAQCTAEIDAAGSHAVSVVLLGGLQVNSRAASARYTQKLRDEGGMIPSPRGSRAQKYLEKVSDFVRCEPVCRCVGFAGASKGGNRTKRTCKMDA